MKKGIILLVMFCNQVIAQSMWPEIPPSPNASALGRYGETQVNLNSGTINPSVPLFDLDEYGIPFSVSLDYRYQGFRPSELVGITGRGWSLNAGGVITRVVNGRKDDAATGYYHLAHQLKAGLEDGENNPANSRYNQVVSDIMARTKDGQPDMFYFSFGKYSGSFFWGADQKFHITSQQKLKIETTHHVYVPTRDQGNHLMVQNNFIEFRVTTEDGTLYRFNMCEYSRSTSKKSEGNFHEDGVNGRFISSWYLSEIIGANGQRISFEYTLAPQSPNRTQFSYYEHHYNMGGPGFVNSESFIDDVLNVSHEIYLEKIRGNGWEINLSYTPFIGSTLVEGQTNSTKQLTKIKFYENRNTSKIYIKGFVLDYFNQYDGYALKTLQQVNESEQALPPYNFTYYGGNFVDIAHTRAIDYFGFYNGAWDNYSMIPELGANRNPNINYAKYGALHNLQYPTGGTETYYYELNEYSFINGEPIVGKFYVDSTKMYQVIEGGVSHNPYLYVPHHIKVDINITLFPNSWVMPCSLPLSITNLQLAPKPGNAPYTLVDILNVVNAAGYCFGTPTTNPNWDEVSFRFNILAHYPSSSYIAPGPGIRIASIVESNHYSEEANVTKNYEYAMEALPEYPSYSSGEIFGRPFYGFWLVGFSTGYFITSNLYHGLSIPQINYSRVTEKINNVRRAVYTFTSGTTDNYNNQQGIAANPLSTNEIGPLSDYSAIRGLMKANLLYSDNLKQTDQTIYGSKSSYTGVGSGFYSTPSFYALIMVKQEAFGQVIVADYGKFYRPVSLWFYPLRQETINYDVNGENPVTSVTELFYDNAEHYQLSRKKHTNSDGVIKEEKFRYPLDYKTVSGKDPIIDSLINNHRVNTIIERTVSSGGQVKGAVAYTFAHHTGNSRKPRLFLPDKEYRFHAAGTFVPYSGQPSGINSASYYEDRAFIAYDTLGQVLDVRDASGIHTSVIRAYRARYPVGIILNALKTEVDVALTQAGTSQNALQNETNNTVIQNVITSLQGSMTSSQVSSFLFRPFTGMQRSILPNAVKTDYEYDSFGRLSGTKNHNGHWSDVYEYQLRGGSTSIYNQVVSRQLRIATTNASVASNHLNAATRYEFLNAFGEPWQTMHWRQSPQANNIVAESFVRDNAGRISRTYLPTSTAITSSLPVMDMFTAIDNFYADNGYSTFEYRGSSGEQKLVRGPGSIWEANNKNTTFSFGTAGSSIRKYTINSSNDISLSGTYPAYSITSTTVIDEQGNVITEYKDKRGLLVERQTQISSGQGAVTHYIYDGLDRLRAVIQPEGFALNSSITSAGTAFTNYVFCYEYDARGRTIRRHVPGAGWTETVYDKAGRPVMSQDAYQKTLNKWNFTQYDAFNREVVKGETTKTTTRSSAQASFDAHGVSYEGRSGATYNGASFPSSLQPAVNEKKLLNYYDDYTFLESQFAFNGSGAFHTRRTNIKGLLAGVKKRNSRDNAKLYTDAFYYDDLNRMIQSQHTHQLSSNNTSNVLIKNLEYNFAGEVVRKNSTFPFNTGTVTLKNKSEYDHAGRVTATGLGINAEPSDILHYAYDEIGRLKQKKYIGTGSSPANPCDVLTDGLVIGAWTVTGHPLVARYFHNKWWLVQRIGSSPDRFIVRGSEMISRSDVTLNNPGYAALVNCFEWKYSDFEGIIPPPTPSVFPVPAGYDFVNENGEEFFRASSNAPCSTPATIVPSVTSPAVNQQLTLTTSCATGTPKWSTNATTNSITITATASAVTYSVTCQGSSCTTSPAVSIIITGTPAGPCSVLTDGLVIGTWTVTNHPLIARYFHNKWWLVQRIATSPERFIVRASEMISRGDVTLNNSGYSALVSCFEWQYSNYGGLEPPATPSVFAVPSGYSYVSENGEYFFQANSTVPCSTPTAIVASVPSPTVNQQLTLTTSCATGTPKWSTNATTNSITITATASAVTYSVTCQGSSCTTSPSVSITITGTPAGPCSVLTDGLVIGTWTVTNHPLIARYFHNKWWLVQRIATSPERFIVRASEMISRPDVTLNNSGYSALASCFEWQYSNYGGLEPPATPSVFAVPSGYSYVLENGEYFFQKNSGGRIAAADFTGGTEGGESTVTLFPNPANDRFDVKISSSYALKDVTLSITDMSGRVIYSGVVDVKSGDNTYPVNSTSFSNGTYMVSLHKGLYRKNAKVVIMK